MHDRYMMMMIELVIEQVYTMMHGQKNIKLCIFRCLFNLVILVHGYDQNKLCVAE